MSVDLYTLAHKPLRLAVSHAAVLLGASEPDAVEGLADTVAGVIAELRAHAAHEHEFIDPLLERYVPDLALEIGAEHARLDASLDAVLRQLDALCTGDTMGPGGPLALYRAVQRMAAMNLLHLDHEETVVMPALWVAAPPSALTSTMDAFRAAHPEAVELFRRWPDALTPSERAVFGLDAPGVLRPRACGSTAA